MKPLRSAPLLLACTCTLLAAGPGVARADAVPPSLAFTSLAEGLAVTGTVNVSLQAADAEGIARLVLAIDGHVVADVPNATSLSHAWNTSGLPERGLHTLVADAYDKNGGDRTTRTIHVTIRDVSGPTITWVHPTAVGVTTDPATLEFRASDPSGVRQLVLSIDGAHVFVQTESDSLTYAWDVGDEPSGAQHTITAAAYDEIGQGSTVSRSVTIVDADAPQVDIVRPGAGSVFGLEQVEVTATDNKAVARLALRINGALVHEAFDATSFVYLWDTTTAPVGSRPVLSALATDAAGNSATNSVPVTVIAEDHVATGARLAIAPSTPDGASVTPVAFADARNSGAQLLYWYFRWNEAAEGPAAVASIMGQLGSGGATAINLSVVNSTVLSTYPAPYASFTDPGFAEDFSDFAAGFAAAYSPAYLFVGNEANIYLESHPDEVGAFQQVIRLTRAKVAVANPATRVGVVVHYDGAMDAADKQLVRVLGEEADLIGYTVYGFRFEGGETLFDDPVTGIRMLEELPEIIPGKPFAVVETGWNTSARFASNEALQTTFVRLLRNQVERSRAEFLSLFLYQDGEDCTEQALSFAEPGSNPDPQSPEVQELAEYLCRFGLRRANGSPKQAWNYIGSTTWPVPEPAAAAQALAVLTALGWISRRSARSVRGR